MEWRQLGLGILTQRPVAELRAAFARTGLFALDLDECIFPGFSQAALGARVFRSLLREPARAGDRRFLPKLLFGGLYFAFTEAKRFLGAPTAPRRLFAWYEWVMRGIPEAYFRQAARRLPRRSYPLASETIGLLASHAPTGLVTLGLDVVAQAYLEQFGTAERPGLTFFESNVLLFRPDGRGESCCAGYDRERLMADGAAKRRALERRLATHGATVATVVGHNDEDVPMARLARETGGLAIGFHPPQRLWDAFDAVVADRSWELMYALVAILAGAAGAMELPAAFS